jgi:hypothetical protein
VDHIFIIQLISSFAVGGLLVAFMSLAAERVSSKTAGVILSLPSTLAISLFFIGLTRGETALADVLPVLPLSLGAAVLFVAVYANIAQKIKDTTVSILVSLTGAIFIWLVIGIPLALFKFDNLFFSITGYIILVIISHLMLYFKKGGPQVIFKYSINQKLFRIIMAGSIIALVVFLTKQLGTVWGGVFSVFPAAYLSSLVIFHKARGSLFLFSATKTLPLTSPIFIIYAVAAKYFFPVLGILAGTFISYLLVLMLMFVYARVLQIRK